MNKQILSVVKVSALALALSFGTTYVYAWTAPTLPAPSGNVNAPINTGTALQTKNGPFTATGVVTGGSINTAGTVTATGIVTGGSINTTGTVTATGAISGSKITAPSHCIGLACIAGWVNAGAGLLQTATGLSVSAPSCNAAGDKLQWTTGTGFACGVDQTGGAGGITGITGGGGVTASAPMSGVVTLGTDATVLLNTSGSWQTKTGGLTVASSITSPYMMDPGGAYFVQPRYTSWLNSISADGTVAVAGQITASGGIIGLKSDNSPAVKWTSGNNIGADALGNMSIRTNQLFITNPAGGNGAFSVQGDTHLAGYAWIDGGIFGLKSDNSSALRWTSGTNIGDDASGNMSIRTTQLFITNKLGGNSALSVQGDTHLTGYAKIDGRIYNATDVCTAGGKCLSAMPAAGGGGVTSLTAGTGITLNGSTGAVTVSAAAKVGPVVYQCPLIGPGTPANGLPTPFIWDSTPKVQWGCLGQIQTFNYCAQGTTSGVLTMVACTYVGKIW